MTLDVLALEKSLISGRWDSSLPDSTDGVLGLARRVVGGSFRESLTSAFARQLFTVPPSDHVNLPFEQALDFTAQLGECQTEGEIIRITLAVACLHVFVQANWTGPNVEITPPEVLAFPTGTPPPTSEQLNSDAISALAYGGEPAYHLAQHAVFLRIAQLLLAQTYEHCASAKWWRLRVATIHQQVLDEPVPVPPEILTAIDELTEHPLTEGPELRGRLLLEAGLLAHWLTDHKLAATYFSRAATATGLAYELTGALGKRTKFQENDLSQLVLLAESRLTLEAARTSDDKIEDTTAISTEKPAQIPETLALNDDTLLEETRFTSSNSRVAGSHLAHLDASAQPALHPLDQSILLSMCLNVQNTSPTDGLTNEQMSAYIDRVISHPRNWSVHTVALLLRSRLESSRTRTVERSTLQLQALLEQMPTSDATLSERLLYFHSIPIPSKWQMEKELAMRFLSLGVVRSALEIFERLEMWEEVVKCWQSMDRADKAVVIVRDLLSGRREESDTVITRGKVSTTLDRRQAFDASREAKLWCLLGDLEPQVAVEHYERAWEVSKHTSGRAMRSLGGYRFARGDYKKAIECLRRAVAINPLLSRSWFVLGCACVREEEWAGAREAFSRCVAIDDEDGESWSNLASVYLRLAETGQSATGDGDADGTAETTSNKSIPFTNKLLAFRALQQGLKRSYDNWRMWNNYMIVAVDVGELEEACRALARVVEETSAKVGAKCVDEDVLDRLVVAVTRGTGEDTDAAVNGNGQAHGRGLEWNVQDLLERVILPRVFSTRIFRAYARLLTHQQRWEDALKAYMDSYRCTAAGSMERGQTTDVDTWRQAVGEVEDIVDVLRNFGPRVDGEGKGRWRLQARSIVRTFMGRTRDFEDEPEWEKLKALQEELNAE